MCTYSFPIPCIISERAFLYCHLTRISFWLEVTVPAYLCMNSTVLTWKTQDFLLDPFAMICIQLITLLLVLQLHINSMCIDQLYWTHSRNGSQAFYCTCSSGSNYTFFLLMQRKAEHKPRQHYFDYLAKFISNFSICFHIISSVTLNPSLLVFSFTRYNFSLIS